MARSKLPYLAIALLAGASYSSLGTGCLLVTDFEPIGEGGASTVASTGTMTTSSSGDTTLTATGPSATSTGTGGEASCPPLTATPFATFDFVGETDTIDGMVVMPSGDGGDWTFVVGHATQGSTVAFDGHKADLDGSFVVKLDPVRGIFKQPVPDSITSLRIAKTGNGQTVTVLVVEADRVTVKTFYTDALGLYPDRFCELSQGEFTGGALSVRNESPSILMTWDDAGATLTCADSPVVLPADAQFAAMFFGLKVSLAASEYFGLGIVPLDPAFAVRVDDSSTDICFGDRRCHLYDGSPTTSDLIRGHAVMTRSVVGSIRAGGGTLENAEPLELTQFAPDDIELDLSGDADFMVPDGGVFGVSSNDKTVVVSGFERGQDRNGAMFLKLVAPATGGEKWTIATYQDPKMSETESWGVGAATNEEGTNLTGAIMYRCPNDTSPVRGAIFTAPF